MWGITDGELKSIEVSLADFGFSHDYEDVEEYDE
jgi:hypothetical protein